MIRSNVNALFFLLLLIVSLQFACKSTPAKPDEALTQRLNTPTFFHNIPADSPYVFTGTEPIPLEIVTDMLGQIDVFLNTFFSFYDKTAEAERNQWQTSVFSRAVLAILQELRGNMSPEGLNKLGFDAQPAFAVYGIGPLPVFRMSLHDPTAFEAFLQRIESAAGITAEHHSLEGVSYRIYRYEDAIFPVALHGNELIAGLVDSKSSDVVLPYMLGVKTPQQSLADNNQIQEIIKTYGLRPFMAAYIDLAGVADMFLEHHVPGSVMSEVMQVFTIGTEEEPFEQPSEACQKDIRDSFADIPRVVMGYESFTVTEVQAMVALEVKSTLASRLDQTRASIPAMKLHSSGDDVMASIGLGVDIQKFVNFLDEIFLELHDNPYHCESMEEFNAAVAKLQQISPMVPPFVTNLRGISVIMKAVSLGSHGISMPTSIDALALVNTIDPSDLLQTLAMFAGFLDVQQIEESDGRPVAIEGFEDQAGLVAPHIAKNATSLGLSVGAGMQDEMAAVMADKSIVASPLLLFSFNYPLFMELLDETVAEDEDMAEFFNAYYQFMRTFGKSTMSFDAGPNALFFRYAIERKPSTL